MLGKNTSRILYTFIINSIDLLRIENPTPNQEVGSSPETPVKKTLVS